MAPTINWLSFQVRGPYFVLVVKGSSTVFRGWRS